MAIPILVTKDELDTAIADKATTSYVNNATVNMVTTDTDQTIIGSKTFNIEPYDEEGNFDSKPFKILRDSVPVFTVTQIDEIAQIDIDGGGDGDVAIYLNGNCGTSGQVLTSHGPQSTPTWESPSGGLSNAELLDKIYPVGSIYMSIKNVSPASFLGGKWQQIKDRFLLSAGDTYVAGTTGGEATHILTAGEMPSHNHSYSKSSTVTGDYALTQKDIPSHQHGFTPKGSIGSGGYASWENLYVTTGQSLPTNSGVALKTTSSAGWTGLNRQDGYAITRLAVSSHSHSFSGVSSNTEGTGGGGAHSHSITLSSANTGSKGGSAAHNNMPPYLAVYMWQRVAD